MTSNRLERTASTVGFNLVVARDAPNVACVFEADLRRSEDVASGVERYPYAIPIDRFAPPGALDACRRLNPYAEHVKAFRRTKVGLASPVRMVRVGVGYYGSRDRVPGVDVKVARFAIKAIARDPEERTHAIIVAQVVAAISVAAATACLRTRLRKRQTAAEPLEWIVHGRTCNPGIAGKLKIGVIESLE
jgi:hypothetical protein